MTIDELREKIDKIDDEIAKLFNERMNVAREIGKAKADSGRTVADRSREKAVINRVTKEVDPDKIVYAKQLYELLFDVSKAYQSEFFTPHDGLGLEIERAIGSTGSEFPVSAQVACQGIEGAYSMLACEKLFKVSDILYFKDWNGVFNAIEKGLCKYGMLPIENSTAGSVNTVYDLVLSHKFHIARSVRLHVRHSLLALPGAELKGIREIYTHEQAAAQCSAFLKKFPLVTVTAVENTAVAARLVSESGRKDVAAISSPECAEIYGLVSLASGIQDSDLNYTRFICITKNLEIYPSSDKISLVMSLPHVTGSLNKMLSKFSALGLNLTKLESRPIPGKEFEFAFYFDFEGDIRKREVKSLIVGLADSLENFAFLGSYSEVR